MKIEIRYWHISDNNEENAIQKFNKGLKPFGWEITNNQEVIINLNTINKLWTWMDKFSGFDEGKNLEFAREYGIDSDYAHDNLYLEFHLLLQIITKINNIKPIMEVS